MADVICNECGNNDSMVFCLKCYEENYDKGYEEGKDDTIAEASEIKQ